jgi:hypothetical protein
MPPTGQPITTTWTAADGAHSLSTYRQQGETDDHWTKRHFDDVAAQMKLHPPI